MQENFIKFSFDKKSKFITFQGAYFDEYLSQWSITLIIQRASITIKGPTPNAQISQTGIDPTFLGQTLPVHVTHFPRDSLATFVPAS